MNDLIRLDNPDSATEMLKIAVGLISEIEVLKNSVEWHKRDSGNFIDSMEKAAVMVLDRKFNSVNRKYRDKEDKKGYLKVRSFIRKKANDYPFTPETIALLYFEFTSIERPHSFLRKEKWEELEKICTYYEQELETIVRFKEFDILVCHPLLIIASVLYGFAKTEVFGDDMPEFVHILAEFLLIKHGYDFMRYAQTEVMMLKTLTNNLLRWDRHAIASGHDEEVKEFIIYFLIWIRECYQKLEWRIKDDGASDMLKSSRIEKVLRESKYPISKREIMERLPDIANQTIQNHLAKLGREGLIVRIGTKRDAEYRWVGAAESGGRANGKRRKEEISAEDEGTSL